MNWNFQERGKTKVEVKAAMAAHPSSTERLRSVEGTEVKLPALCPAAVLATVAAAVDALPEVEGATVIATTSGDEAGFTVNVALQLPSALEAAQDALRAAEATRRDKAPEVVSAGLAK